MKIIEVSAAIIIKDKRILITQRGYGDFKDKWEFPGGKLKLNESKEKALIREIKEEMNAEINIIKYLGCFEYQYPTFYLKMHCFISKIENNSFKLLEHEAFKFVTINEIKKEDMLPADNQVIPYINNYLSSLDKGETM